jgi:bacillithiol biosynthesis cysteine-adding enzyme BshC
MPAGAVMAGWSSVSFDALPGFGRFFVDHAGNRLPEDLKTIQRPDIPGVWSARAAKRGLFSLDRDLHAALDLEHRRLGASPESLASLRALRAGEAFAVITGQQPGLMGGPLFTYLKIATVTALARWLTDVHGLKAVPVFWNGADDADFDEVSSAQVPKPDLSLLRFAIPGEEHRSRAWVGDIAGEVTYRVMSGLDPAYAEAPVPGFEKWRAWREGVRDRLHDFGDWTTAHYLRWFAMDGLVVADARLPEIRRAAQPLFRRYLERADQVRNAIVRQGELMEKEGYAPPIPAETAASALFITPGRERLRLSADEALAEAARLVDTHPSDLSPNVILRPIVADTIFPTLAHVAGPSETVYLSQLAPAFEWLSLPPPVVADRLSITLFPTESLEVARDLQMRPQDLLGDPADALKRWYERQTPPDLDHALREGRSALEKSYARISESSRTLDASLPQMVDSALEKSLFQIDRLKEGVLKKLKHRRELASPRYRHLPDFLLPRRRPQERELAALSLELLFGESVRERIDQAAREHVENLSAGVRSHYIGSI